MVAVGPYHRGKQGLKMMEEHKLRFLKSLLARKNDKVDRYISAAAEMEQKARSCYTEYVSLSSAEFIEMLVLDSCFIIGLLTKCLDSGNRIQNISIRPDIAADPIFQIMGIMRFDLILFENQIPSFVLCKLFDLIDEEPNQHGKLVQSFLALFGLDGLNCSKGMNRELENMKHLLHLVHATWRPSSPVYVDVNVIASLPLRELRLIPTATELKNANITFRKCGGITLIREGKRKNPFEVDFNNGVLTMAPLTIDDDTDRLFRNLIFYEQYSPDNLPTYITDYMVLMDNLVNTAQDVEILSESGIIENVMGDNKQAADIINRLNRSVFLHQTLFIHANTFNLINAHYKRSWNRAMAVLNRDYFSSPWAYISFFAALLLLLLTLAQTVFSALQLK